MSAGANFSRAPPFLLSRPSYMKNGRRNLPIVSRSEPTAWLVRWFVNPKIAI